MNAISGGTRRPNKWFSVQGFDFFVSPLLEALNFLFRLCFGTKRGSVSPLAVADHHILQARQTFKPHRSTGMQFSRADADFCAQAVFESVGKPR